MNEEEEFEFRARLEAEETQAEPDVITPAEPAKGLFRRGMEVAARWLDRVPAAARGAMQSYQEGNALTNPQTSINVARAAWEGLTAPESAPTSAQVMEGFGASAEPREQPVGLPPNLAAGRPTMGIPVTPQTVTQSEAEGLGNALDLGLPSGLEFLPLGMALKAARKPVGGALAKPIRAGAERIQQTVLKPRKGDWDAGIDIANIEKHGLQGSVDEVFGKSDEKIKATAETLRGLIQEGADEGASVNLFGSLVRARKTLEKEAPADLVSKLDPIFEEFEEWATRETARGGRGEGVDLLRGHEFKQMMGAHGSWEKTAAAKNLGITEAERYKSRAAQAVYRAIKEDIEKAAPPGIKELNQTLSELIPIRNAAAYRKIVADRNNPISLGDMLSAMTAVGNGPAGAALFGAQKFTTKGFGAKSLYSLAKLLDGPPAEAAAAAAELKKGFGFTDEDLAALKTRNDPVTAPAGRNVPNIAWTRRSLAEPEPGSLLPPELRGAINWNEEPAGRFVPNIPGTRRPLPEFPEPPRNEPDLSGNIPDLWNDLRVPELPPMLQYHVPGPYDHPLVQAPKSMAIPDEYLPENLRLPPEIEAALAPRRPPDQILDFTPGGAPKSTPLPPSFPNVEPEAFREVLNNFGRRQLPPNPGPQMEFPAAYADQPWTPSSLPPDLLAQLPPDVQEAMLARLRSLAAPDEDNLPPYLRRP
jgi:hypothetical protein